VTLGSPSENWYQMLGLQPGTPSDAVASAIERLSRQASVMANTDPERSQRLRETIRDMRHDLMSGEEARKHYDEAITRLNPPHPAGPNPAGPPSHATMASSPTQPLRESTMPTGEADHPAVIDSVASAVLPVVARFRRFLQSGWTCPSCGAEGTPSDRFCTSCGGAMKVAQPERARCVNCQSEFGTDERYCGRCGAPRT
jgi:hypothetical protein